MVTTTLLTPTPIHNPPDWSGWTTVTLANERVIVVRLRRGEIVASVRPTHILGEPFDDVLTRARTMADALTRIYGESADDVDPAIG